MGRRRRPGSWGGQATVTTIRAAGVKISCHTTRTLGGYSRPCLARLLGTVAGVLPVPVMLSACGYQASPAKLGLALIGRIGLGARAGCSDSESDTEPLEL